jgi:hypothetical protein
LEEQPINLDLIGAIALTASAAIVVAALTSAFGKDTAGRIRLAAGLNAWFVLVVILAATRVLYPESGLGALGLGAAVVLPIVIFCLVVARSKALREAFHRVPLALLVGVQTIRVLGVVFVLLYAAGRLPAPFAPVAGWGDILVGVTAPAVAWVVHRGLPNWRRTLWAWNIVGALDLIVAVFLGRTSAPGPLRLFTNPAQPSSPRCRGS